MRLEAVIFNQKMVPIVFRHNQSYVIDIEVNSQKVSTVYCPNELRWDNNKDQGRRPFAEILTKVTELSIELTEKQRFALIDGLTILLDQLV